ncbi:ionotropic receptor 21a-like [Panulirus ornatus]|uniref:ionotropic receptor 21a-like n=1 Tax=Panulirus ornatus TaxID=150431 RepID=UPI003A893144
MVAQYFNVLPQRLERYDFSFIYEFSSLDFCTAKPMLRPQWQSLYYPLSGEVWASVLATVLLLPMTLYMNSCLKVQESPRNSRGIGVMIQEAFGTLLGQNISQWLPRASSSRVLVAAWLVFAFIIGTVYRGNLTAALTLPKYPPRPETLEELVNYVDRVTMPPFGKDFKRQFKESGSRTMEKLADLMLTGPSLLEGLKQALEKKQAHLAARHAINHWIAERFTGADGSSLMYFGKERIDPGASAWPIPHDAPYKRQLDQIMTAVNEAGLYDKWTEDTVDEARRDGQMKRRERSQDEEEEKSGHARNESPTGSSKSSKALTIIHTQGPLMLLLLGHILAGLTFITEILSIRYCY